MATVPITMSFSFIDKIGVPASLHLYGSMSDATTIATMRTDFESIIEDVAGITDAGLTKAEIAVIGDVTGFTTPGDDSTNEQGVLMNFSQGAFVYKYGVWVPSVKDTLVVDGKIVVGSGAIAAFVSLMVGGAGSITNLSKYSSALTGLVDAAEAFRKLRRRAEKLTRTAGS